MSPISATSISAAKTHFAVLLFLAALPADSPAQDPLPEEMPTRRVTVKEAIREIVAAVEEIESAERRRSVLTSVSYDVHQLDRVELEPLTACLLRALPPWPKLGDPNVAAAVIARLSPQAALRACQSMDLPKVRDGCLRNYVSANANRDWKELLPLLNAIDEPATKAQAWMSLATSERLTWEQAKAALTEVRKIRDLAEAAGSIYALGARMSYFAKDHPDDVAQYLTEALPADKAVVVIGQASHYCSFQYKSPEVTRALLNAAAALIPRCEDKAAATESLLNCWLARHHPAVALSLFDEYLEPRINKTPDYPISYLWPARLPATLERAQRFCDKRSIASTGIVSRTLGRVASFEPDLAIQWLETAAPSDLRDAATVEIVGDLTLELSNRPPLRQDAARWVELGARRTLEISSDELRAKGCEQLAALVNFLHVQPKIVLPQSIREEYARLWPNLRKDSEADYIFQMAWARPALLPDEVVEGAIRDTIRGKRMYAAPAIVAGTSWSTARKAKWYNEFLKATRAEPDLRRRASALTELAPCWRRDDPKQCLLVLWEAMQIARSLGLRRIQDGFEGVETPYVSADDSLRFGFGNKPADLRTQETLWSFAHGLESLEDRDAVLEAFVGVAAHQGQVEKAAGITSLLGNPARRARAWGAVAVVISGKPLRNDW